MKITKLPWMVNGNAITNWRSKFSLGQHIASQWVCDAKGKSYEKCKNWKNNSAFIVNAVNNHRELVDALEACLSYFEKNNIRGVVANKAMEALVNCDD